jgi:hypothetical protein
MLGLRFGEVCAFDNETVFAHVDGPSKWTAHNLPFLADKRIGSYVT